MAYTIIQNYVPSSMYNVKAPYSMSPIGVTIHNTANDASAANEVAYMKSNYNEVSYHVAVDDKNVVLAIPFNRNAWHAGDGSGNGNRKTIGIEICYSKSGGTRFTNAEKNAAAYVATILKEYGWTLKNVYKHQDWSGKYCPHRTLDMGWGRFKNMIQAELDKLNGKNPATTTPASKPATSTPAATSKKNLGKVNITMQGYTNKWWSPVVNNSDWVGQADGVPLRYLAVKVDKGTITGRVYTQGSGWLPKLTFGNSYNIKDLNNGVLGDGTPIQAVELYYNTPSGYNYQKVHYQVSGINTTAFYSEQVDNEKGNGMDGYAGAIGVNIDKIKAYIK